MTCLSCLSNQGKQRISPGPTIHESTHWVVEHAYPSELLGWIVLATKRHVEELHNLTEEEFAELHKILPKVIKSLRQLTNCEKEYVMCLAEKEGFKHIHFHVVPKPHELPEELKGAKIFKMLKCTAEEAVSKEHLIEFCKRMKVKK